LRQVARQRLLRRRLWLAELLELVAELLGGVLQLGAGRLEERPRVLQGAGLGLALDTARAVDKFLALGGDEPGDLEAGLRGELVLRVGGEELLELGPRGGEERHALALLALAPGDLDAR